MTKTISSIWFWQRNLTPHMGSLAESLTKKNYVVNFVSNSVLTKDRKEQGWEKAKLRKAKFILATNKTDIFRLSKKIPKNSLHFCQGIRGNGLIGYAQKILRNRGLKQWAMIERIDDDGWKSQIKKILYSIHFFYWKKYLEGVLAIGYDTKDWIIKRGMNKAQVHSFAYFLKKPKIEEKKKYLLNTKNKGCFRFIFAGQLIRRKRVDMLINAIAALKIKDLELWIAGDGPCKKSLYLLSKLLLPGRVHWLGVLSMSKIPQIIKQADCLVLPSRHDGWGAVVSESLMVGTPVICSNKCGASSIVKASDEGEVFLYNDQMSLIKILKKQYEKGKISIRKRKKIIKWSKCINSNSGAKYLDLIIKNNSNKLISVPWKK